MRATEANRLTAIAEIQDDALFTEALAELDALNGFGVPIWREQGFQKPRGEAGAADKVGHALQSAKTRDGHDARDDRDSDASEFATLTEIVESWLSKKTCVQM